MYSYNAKSAELAVNTARLGQNPGFLRLLNISYLRSSLMTAKQFLPKSSKAMNRISLNARSKRSLCATSSFHQQPLPLKSYS